MLLKLPVAYNKPLFGIACIFLLLFTGCSKDTVQPDIEEDDMQTNEYEIQNLQYFLSDEDGIDTVRVKFDPEAVNNPSNDPFDYQYIEKFEGLTKTSAFQLDTIGQNLPSDLDLSQFEVNVPAAYHTDGSFSYHLQRFAMSGSLQEDVYDYSTVVTLDTKIPARTKRIFSKELDRHDMICSFKATVHNKTTGERYTVNGKWKGVLRYFNDGLKIKDEALD